MKNIIYVLLLLLNTSSFALAEARQQKFFGSEIPLNILEVATTTMQMQTIKHLQIMTMSSAFSPHISSLPTDCAGSSLTCLMPAKTIMCVENPAGALPYNFVGFGVVSSCKNTMETNMTNCLANPYACTSQVFVGSQGLVEYTSQRQFIQGFAAIVNSRTYMEVKLNEGVSITLPSEIGLPSSSTYCSSITATGDAITGAAEISCTLNGGAITNSPITGKKIILTRIDVDNAGIFIWTCSSNLPTDEKFKYGAVIQCQ